MKKSDKVFWKRKDMVAWNEGYIVAEEGNMVKIYKNPEEDMFEWTKGTWFSRDDLDITYRKKTKTEKGASQ